MQFLNGKTTDLDWFYSRHNQNFKFLIWDFVKKPFAKKPHVKCSDNLAGVIEVQVHGIGFCSGGGGGGSFKKGINS